jgi:uncharacterized delta-60 repeat protein
VSSTAGSLDPTFDVDGKATTPIGAYGDYTQGVALQSDGKAVLAGYSLNDGWKAEIAVARYNTDGSLDKSFAANPGKVITAVGARDDTANSVAVQSDGKIIVAGGSDNHSDDQDFAVVRYNADGSFDASFDRDGRVTTAIGSAEDQGESVSLQSDGKIVVAGYSHNGSNYDIAVVRYNGDGSLDTSFHTDGKVTTAIGSGDDYGYSAATQNDGKIVVAGNTYNGSNYDFAVVRYNGDGSLDTSFQGNGKVTTAIRSGHDLAEAVAVQSDGKIIVVGAAKEQSGGKYDFAVVRYNPNGTLDTSFDGDGKVMTAIGESWWESLGESVSLQSDGKIVVAGRCAGYMAVVRYNADGSLDTSFDGDGWVTTDVGSHFEYGESVAVLDDGKIVVAGYSHDGSNYDFAVVRYNGDGSLDASFDGDGKVTTPIGLGHDYGHSVVVQSDRKIVVAGATQNGDNYDIAVARYIGVGTPVPPDLQAASDSGVGDTDNITNDNTPTFDLELSDTYFRFWRDGTQISGDYESGTSYTTAVQADGTYAYSFSVVDAAGNESALSAALDVTIDTTPPMVALVGPTEPTDDTTPSVSVTASDANGLPDGTTVMLDVDLNNDGDFDDAGELGYTTSSLVGGTTTFDVSPALADGTYPLRARVSDIAGNEGTDTATLEIGAPLTLESVEVSKGATQRSYLRYVDLIF